VSITRPSSQTSTVRAVMFRCTHPWPCSTRSAVSTSEATSAARYGLSGRSASSAASGRAATISLTIHNDPPSANTSKTWSSRGWSGIWAAACAASIARRTAGSVGRRVVRADGRRTPVSRATNPSGSPSASSTSASTISGNGTCRTRTSCPLYVSKARDSASSYSSDGGSGRR
jgi:hypothetical protein